MKLSTAIAILGGSAVNSVLAAPSDSIFAREVGGSCKAPEGSGKCLATADCKGISYPTGLCPTDPVDIQCCVEHKCEADGGSGYCRSVKNNGCSNGKFVPGTSPPYPCPGGSDIQCCVTKEGGSEPEEPEKPEEPKDPKPPTDGDDVGAKVLEVALTAKGLPYAWGGGTCDGPSEDIPPYQHGDIGYDCSGLVCWAVCQVTGRDLFSEGLRVTSSMYCASESKLKYKKYPLSERKAGDAVFFGGSCDCGSGGIYHVALMMDDGDRMWNAPNDRVNQVQENSLSNFGDAPCPQVIRFT